MTSDTNIIGLTDIMEFLEEFPERIQRRVCRLAVKKAAAAIKGREAELTPRQAKKSPGRDWHTADKYITKPWNRQDIAMQLIGVQSGFGRLAHLIERGTTDRWTNMKTGLRTTVVGTKVRTRRVKLENGGYRTIKETVNHTKRVGTGSVPKAGGRGKWVGRMPAFHPAELAAKDMAGIALQIIETEVRAGLSRVLAKSGAEG
jgi:hypothetical protein